MTGVYLYGILRSEDGAAFGPIGLPTGDEEVVAVAEEGIAGVASRYHGPQSGDLSRQEILRRLVIHQRVIETVMREHTVLPVKFGTVLPSAAELQRALRHGRRELGEALREFDGMVQYEVAATWELGPVFAEIAAEAEIARLRSEAAALPPAESLGLRVTLGAMIKESLDRRREDLGRCLTSLLAEGALAHQANALMGDEMVMNGAFLLPGTSRGDFTDRLHRVDARFEGKLNLRCIGPLPPYSFGTVELLRPDQDGIEAALRLLDLDDPISVADVRRAYRERAARLHPDVNRSPEAADLFPRLKAAESLLTACCLAGAGGGRQADTACRVAGGEEDRTYLVVVRRATDPRGGSPGTAGCRTAGCRTAG